ncbi:MAG: hypothetical protein C5B55_08730 [Blastocatellia bacterium]|nr:MAG: hypothetical protein C5B55_08730 [Blastocatellia bacterium]
MRKNAFNNRLASQLVKALLLTVVGCSTGVSFGQRVAPKFGKGAVVLEKKLLLSAKQPNRALVLWMIDPKKNPREIANDEPYTCPDYTRGSYYSGPVRVSLINTSTGEILNTIKVLSDYEPDNDSFDLPYAIRKGYYYHVASSANDAVEHTPTLIRLRDYNGDGKPFEFALFDAPACMGLATTLIGYSETKDRVIQYAVRLEEIEGTKHSTTTTMWADYLLAKKPLSPGLWKYEVDYRGRGGSLDHWEIRYNAAKEQFEGTVTRIPGD